MGQASSVSRWHCVTHGCAAAFLFAWPGIVVGRPRRKACCFCCCCSRAGACLTRLEQTGVQGLSESDGPITVAYTFDANEFAADSEEVVEPVPIAGETEPPEEGGAVQKIDFVKDHKLAPVGHKGHEDMLLNLVTKQFKFTVTGTVGEGDFKGLFDVDTKELIWRDHPDPDEDDDKKKDYPFINGDFEVKRVGEETEDGSPNLTDSSLKVSLCIELSDYVMTVEEGEQSNVMTIVVEEMHNLPKAWSLEEGDEGGDEHAFAYRANYAFPSMNGGIKEVTAQPGKMVPATPPASQPEGEGAGEGDEEQDVVQQQQKFPSTDQEPEPEIAVLQHTLREVDVNKEKKAQRVAWHHEFTSFMSPSVIKDFADALRKGTKFAVDLKRIYKDEDKDYIYAAKYHGKSEMDLSKILEEDTTSITVRSPVGPAASQLPPLTEEEAPDAPDAEKDQVLQDNHITAPYLLYETYLVVTVSTTRPIVKRPPAPPPVLDSVSSLLPKRTPVPAYRPQTDGEEDYRSELRNIIVDMTEAYLKLQDNLEGDSSNPENVKNAQKEMMLHLASKSVGKWHDFKVKLKTAVLKVINERCHQLSFGGVEMDAADEIGKLNTFLRDEMNEALAQAFEAKKSFNDEPSLAVLQTLLDEELRLAFEAEVRMDYRSACVHLAKRIVATKDDPDDDLKATLWYDLGTVTCRAGDDEKAEECFRKAINFQSKHINANMALGTLLCKRDNYKEADQYFRRASDGTSDVMAWSCFGVFCDLDAKEQDRKACFKQLAQAEKKTGAIKKSPYLRAGSFFVELYATQLVERAMTQEFMRNPGGEMDTYESWETTPNSTEELKVLLGKAYLCNKQFAKARMHLDDAMARARDKNSAVALCLKGHTHYLEQNWHLYRCDRAIPKNAGFPYPYEKIPSKQTVSIDEFYSKAMMAKPPFIDIEQYYRLARLLIASEPPKLPAAQKQLIEACKLQPSATTWLGLAVAYYHDKKYVEAEHACAEAIILDVHNGEAWGMTCLIALRQILELPEPENENSPGAIQLPDGRLVDVEFPPKLKEVRASFFCNMPVVYVCCLQCLFCSIPLTSLVPGVGGDQPSICRESWRYGKLSPQTLHS